MTFQAERRVSPEVEFSIDPNRPREKMSKSRGNVVTVDEVARGIASLASGCEFRDQKNRIVDFREWNISRDIDGMYYTAARFGREPVFLCYSDRPVPPVMLINGIERLQHEQCLDFWQKLVEQYPEEEN